MPSVDIIKIAPTLSAEERFKMMVADVHKQMAGEKAVFSLSERSAIMKCEHKAMWEEYTRHIGIMQWATAFWMKDIEAERLRVFAGSLLLERMLDHLVDDADIRMPESIRKNTYIRLKEFVDLLESQSELFYAYREAIAQIEAKHLYGMPLFDEKRKAMIAGAYDMTDTIFEMYNHRLTMFAGIPSFEDFMKPISENIGDYTVKKPVPRQETIDKIINEIMEIADSEMEMLLR
jgi:hypothetical protein